ncbi:MAG: site-2 protease family protein [Clostridiales bacterium]|jgi:Zn-dependent protease|nr:site-2 protease family protein [Clostridiales bacterium]
MILFGAFGFGYSGQWFIEIFAVAIAVVISIVLHELAHGYVALLNGDPTAKLAGRLTLNPVKHFDLTGFLMLMLVGFGYAKPVPINPYNFKRRRPGILTVSLAGVTVNFLLAFCSMPLYILTVRYIDTNVFLKGVNFVLRYLLAVNVSLMLFNLLPLFPLDGYRVVEGLTRVTNPVTKFLRNYGRYILLAAFVLHLMVNFLTGYFPNAGWLGYFDPLGLYIDGVGGWILTGFDWVWGFLW